MITIRKVINHSYPPICTELDSLMNMIVKFFQVIPETNKEATEKMCLFHASMNSKVQSGMDHLVTKLTSVCLKQTEMKHFAMFAVIIFNTNVTPRSLKKISVTSSNLQSIITVIPLWI